MDEKLQNSSQNQEELKLKDLQINILSRTTGNREKQCDEHKTWRRVDLGKLTNRLVTWKFSTKCNRLYIIIISSTKFEDFPTFLQPLTNWGGKRLVFYPLICKT